MVIRRNVKFWKSDKFLFFVLYSIVFACMAKICFISFEDARKGFGWVIDSLPVQLPMLAELRNLIRDFLGIFIMIIPYRFQVMILGLVWAGMH